MPRSLGLLALLLSLPMPIARAAIVPGPELAPVRRALAPPAFDQFSPRLASNGNGFLAVWTDTAAVPAPIHATRVTVEGTPVDASPIVIDEEGVFGDVIWDGRRYVVVWSTNRGVYGRFVEADGAMSAPFPISAPAPYFATFGFPHVAFNGRAYLVAWTDYVTSPKFVATIVDLNGAVMHRLELGDANTWSSLTAVAAVGDTFSFVSSDIDFSGEFTVADLGITRIGEDGSVGARVVVLNSFRTDAAASNEFVQLQARSRGSDALVAWTNGAETFWLRVTDAGLGAVESFAGNLNTIAPDRSGYLLIYDEESGRYARRAGSSAVSSIAKPEGESVVGAGADSLLITSTVPATRYFDSALGYDVYLQHAGDDAFTPVTLAPRQQMWPHLAAAGPVRLAAWMEVLGQRMSIVAARIGPNGEQLDPEGIDLNAQLLSNSVKPFVAAGPDQWLIVWHDRNRVAGSRVAFDGRLLDAEPFTIAAEVHYLDSFVPAWDGERFVVAFTRGVPTRLGGSFAVMAARVDANGVVESPEIQLTNYSAHFSPSIAVGPNGSLVAWVNLSTGTLEGALLSRAGTVTRVAFPLFPRFHRTVDVAWNGETFLVAAPEAFQSIRWFFVSPSGTVTPAPASAQLSYETADTPLDVEPHGDGFLIAYERLGTIYAATINRSGYVEHAPVAVATTTVYARRVGLAGTTLVYARNDDALRNRTSRVFVKELTISANAPKRRAVHPAQR